MLLCVTACGLSPRKTEVIEVPVRQYVDLPPTLLEDTPAPAFPEPGTWEPGCYDARTRENVPCGADLIEWIEDGWAVALDRANCDKAILRCIDANKGSAQAEALTNCLVLAASEVCYGHEAPASPGRHEGNAEARNPD